MSSSVPGTLQVSAGVTGTERGNSLSVGLVGRVVIWLCFVFLKGMMRGKSVWCDVCVCVEGWVGGGT